MVKRQEGRAEQLSTRSTLDARFSQAHDARESEPGPAPRQAAKFRWMTLRFEKNVKLEVVVLLTSRKRQEETREVGMKQEILSEGKAGGWWGSAGALNLGRK